MDEAVVRRLVWLWALALAVYSHVFPTKESSQAWIQQYPARISKHHHHSLVFDLTLVLKRTPKSLVGHPQDLAPISATWGQDGEHAQNALVMDFGGPLGAGAFWSRKP